MDYATQNPRCKNLNAADEVPTTGKGAGELWTFLELGDESEAKHDAKNEAEDEEEWDPNDLVHKAAHEQQFSRLFNNPHARLNASEWKERNKNERCECCSTSRNLPCSRLDDFRRESIMKEMDPNENLWEELIKDHVEVKGRKAMDSRKEMGRRVGEAEKQETEEIDEVDSDNELLLNVTTVDGSKAGHRKCGRAVTDNGGVPLSLAFDV
ncbi:hypothetical protein PQX77_021244 [Marasmius sp. AFHP31]|nr:hypothetical protein PQX77_021244 [Marasmius sp. AFHP31]